MGTNERDVLTVMRRIIAQETRFLRSYIGQVISNDDDQNAGRVLVSVPALGWADASQAAWCWPRQVHAMSVPAVGEFVEVGFINGDGQYPVYNGIASEIQGSMPGLYSAPSVHVLFEDPDGKVHLSFDAGANVLEIGNQSHQQAARKGDATVSDATTDSTFWTWFAAMAVFLNGLGFTNPPPTSQAGKVNAGSGQVKIGDA